MNFLLRTEMKAGEAVVTFNQNLTSLAVASHSGYTIYNLESVDSLKKIHAGRTKEICLIERLLETSLLAMVTCERKKLILYHLKREREINTYWFTNPILSVKMNPDYLVVCFERSIHIYNIHNINLIHAIAETPPNFNGVFDLSPSTDHPYLAYPCHDLQGKIQIFDAMHAKFLILISAHDTNLVALAFSPTGKEIASASERGNIIRIFSCIDGDKLFEFRRGLKRCVTIVSLAFSTCSEYLISASNTETVHVFRLNAPAAQTPEEGEPPSSWIGAFGKTVTSLLPAELTNVFTHGKPFASIILPTDGIRRICGITKIKKQLRLLIASEDGFLYVYTVPSGEYEECKLVKKHDLLHDDYYVVDNRGAASSSADAIDTPSTLPSCSTSSV